MTKISKKGLAFSIKMMEGVGIIELKSFLQIVLYTFNKF
jgi:hypothetical protein